MLNIAEKVSFFNTVIQVLDFRNYVHKLSTSVPEHLFLEFQNPSIAVRTARHLQVLNLNGYIHSQQNDAHKCLIQLMQKFYSGITDAYISKISIIESTMCEGNCGYSTENTFLYEILNKDCKWKVQ